MYKHIYKHIYIYIFHFVLFQQIPQGYLKEREL